MRHVLRLAERSHGLFTTAQAESLGVSRHQLYRRHATGVLDQPRRGVWRVAGTPATFQQSVLAAVLAAGAPGWASHRTAARLWQLRVPPPEAIDVLTLPRRRMRLDGVAHHVSEEIRLADVGAVAGVPVTTVARTLVDCAPFLRGRLLGRAVDDAMRRKLLTFQQLDDALQWLDRGRRTGRHRVVPVRPVVADRDPGGSDLELDVLAILVRAGVEAPVQQHRVDLPSGPRYLDHAWPWAKVALEVDGFSEHGLIRSVFDDDRDRDAELQLEGWLVLHATSNTSRHDLVRRVNLALSLRAA